MTQVRWTKQTIMADAQDKNVRYIRLMFTDITGTIKNVEIPRSQLEKALDNQMMFDGSSIEGFVPACLRRSGVGVRSHYAQRVLTDGGG